MTAPFTVTNPGSGTVVFNEKFLTGIPGDTNVYSTSKTINFDVISVHISATIEDREVGNVKSGLIQDTLKFSLNNKQIGTSSLSIQPTTEIIDGRQITNKLDIIYFPTRGEVNLPGTNTVKVEIDDAVANHMDPVVQTFQLP